MLRPKPPPPTDPDRAALRTALLDWYDAAARPLPWRGTRDPYSIWVSEVMLQQTRVETVIPYYERFLERFPTPAALAAAAADDVLAAWSGLGYYRRARLLHAGVREVVERYGGTVPADPEARRALPGVGRYTAGAIGSIAFGRAEPVVDGNVARVLARVLRVETPLGRADTESRLWAEATALVEGPWPGDLNQALMELGATVCTPRSPACARCPAAGACAARAAGVAETLPVPRARRPPREVALVAVVAVTEPPERTLFVRSAGRLFGGLFDLPSHEGTDRADAREALSRHGIAARLARAPVAELEHVLTHRRLRVRVFRATRARAELRDDLRALAPEQLDRVGISRLTRRILELGA